MSSTAGPRYDNSVSRICFVKIADLIDIVAKSWGDQEGEVFGGKFEIQ